jgi:hypothetical protein
MAVFKDIGGGHTLEKIAVNTLYTFEWISGSSNFDGFSVNLAEDPTVVYPSYPYGTDDMGVATDNDTFSYPLFNSVKNWYFEADIYDFYPSHSMFIVDIGSQYFGDYVEKGSFKLELTGNSDFIKDDSDGNLRINGTGDVVGTIFYDSGLAAIQRNFTASANLISSDGIAIQGGSTVTTNFSSSMDIYEHTVVCNAVPADFNRTINVSSTITGSDSKSYYQHIYSGSAFPYVTTIGLYNDLNELLVVAKLSSPITRTKYSDQTFIIKFDE